MNLTVNQTNYGEKVVFTVTMVNTTLNGTVKIYINKISETVKLENGTAILTKYNMAPNHYVVIAEYEEYNQTLETDVQIDVRLRNSTMNITANNVTYGTPVTVNITVTNGTTGIVYLFVNNKKFTVNLVNSTGQINITNLPGGNHTIFAVYNGDVNFIGCDGNASFSVTKFNPVLIVAGDERPYGQPVPIYVNASKDITNKLIVYVDSTQYIFNSTITSFVVYN